MRHTWGMDVTGFDAPFVDKVLSGARKVFGPRRYFELTVRGLEHVPANRQVMLVSNHSGGTSIPDVWGLAVAWYNHFGTQRPLHILAHDLLFALPATAHIFERLGVLRASNKIARRALASGKDLLIYPGGDRETWRPYSDRYKVNFSGRTGYAKLAIDANVPIVPVAHAGSHETLRVLTSGRRIAVALGLPKFARAEVFPISLSLPWGLTIGPLPHIPWPTEFRYLIGAPIPHTDDAEGAVELDTKVRGAIQAQLEVLHQDELTKKRRVT